MYSKRSFITQGNEMVEVEICATYTPHRRWLELAVQFPYFGKTFAESKIPEVRRASIRWQIKHGDVPASLTDLVEQARSAVAAESELWFKPSDKTLTRDIHGGYGAQLDLNPLPQILERVVQDYIKEYKGGEAG